MLQVVLFTKLFLASMDSILFCLSSFIRYQIHLLSLITLSWK